MIYIPCFDFYKVVYEQSGLDRSEAKALLEQTEALNNE